MQYCLNCKEFNDLEVDEQIRIKGLNWTLFSDKESVSSSNFEESYVIFDNRDVVAMISFEPLEDDIYIFHFEVLKKRQGYGRQIINDLKKYFTKYKYIIVDAKDKASYDFWTSIGFKPKGEDLFLKI